ncbi:MAG: HipA domain-containing protein [Paludibacterium sp.]|uniref:type II toxin-antitoxin system HipA family toxin n=1 Tax=Paludibacterium sp. TaxID=1917523 RepID=UPI0025EEBCD2|nr:HipA domain-containing protein [Paludibacterium sp.]MBV8046920.1 HipA domain-containing protein [Paludibacterium sp.]MBV8646366.1 HipA domain-containing protein [Paludibacterium sp.]
MMREIYTGIVLPGQGAVTAAARVRLEQQGLFEEGVFAYGRKYQALENAIALNPGYLPLENEIFPMTPTRSRDGGALNLTLKDALPDAWGRLVIQARNNWNAVSDVDVLLQTNADRVGAMVFAERLDEIPDLDLSVKSFRLEDLAKAAHALEFDMDVPPEFRRLLRQGGSLGGARPKASFVRERSLWIAKFPAKDDELDVQLLEHCTLLLASQCGIRVPDHLVVSLGKIHSLLLRRFDRPGLIEQGARIHYLSAAAFTDSPYESNAGSYVKLAEHLRRYGANVAEDLAQLFRRMVFNMLIDNSDDHVKNHGVLHVGGNRYALAPAFDLVPQLTNLGYMGMAMIDQDLSASLDTARQHAPRFGLTPEVANRIIGEVAAGVRLWRPVFESCGADKAILARVEACFQRQARIVGIASV